MDIYSEDDEVDPFSVGRLWKTSKFSKSIATLPRSQKLPSLFNVYTLDATSQPLKLPPIYRQALLPLKSSFTSVSTLSSEPSLTHSSPSSSDNEADHKLEGRSEHRAKTITEGCDPWRLPEVITPELKPQLKTWEAFLAKSRQTSTTHYNYDLLSGHGPTYLSEAPVPIISAALSTRPALQTDVLLSSLLSLSLGYPSIIFQKESASEFSIVPELDPGTLRFADLQSQTLKPLIDRLLGHASRIIRIRSFIEKITAENVSTAHLALSSALSVMLSTFAHHVRANIYTVTTPLQLRALIVRPEELFQSLSRLIQDVESGGPNVDIVTMVYQAAEVLEDSNDWLYGIYLELLRSVSRPFVGSLVGWMGLCEDRLSGTRTAPAFITKEISSTKCNRTEKSSAFATQREERERDEVMEHLVELQLIEHKVPRFVAPSDAHTVLAAGRSLQFLTQHDPDCASYSGARLLSSCELPQWGFTWTEADSVQRRAEAYSKRAEECIGGAAKKDHSHLHLAQDDSGTREEERRSDVLGLSAEEKMLILRNTPRQLTTPSYLLTPLSRELEKSFESVPTTSEPLQFCLPPMLSETSSLTIFPVIRAHVSLLATRILRLLFTQHELEAHLSLLFNIPLLADGHFCAVLSETLFSSSNYPRQGRSNLRFALEQILDDMNASGRFTTIVSPRGFGKTSPSSLGFAVKAPSPSTIEDDKAKISNDIGTGIPGLESLHVLYVPPPALRGIISFRACDLTIRIFQALLKGLRMRGLMTGQFRLSAGRRDLSLPIVNPIALKMRHEAACFVDILTSYYHDIAVAAPWRAFEKRVRQLRSYVFANNGGEKSSRTTITAEMIAASGGPEAVLRHWLEEALECMASALLTRKPQVRAARALDAVCEEIVHFTSVMEGQEEEKSDGPSGETAGQKEALIAAVHARFRKRVMAFCDVCREASGRQQQQRQKGRDGVTIATSNESLHRGMRSLENGTTVGRGVEAGDLLALLVARLGALEVFYRTSLTT